MKTVGYGEGGGVMVDLRVLPRSDARVQMSITKMGKSGMVTEFWGRLKTKRQSLLQTCDLGDLKSEELLELDL